MTQGDEKWEAMTDEEFVADYVTKHGYEAAVAMAKFMQLPSPKPGVKPERRRRVGVKPKPRMALGKDLVPPQGVSWREQDSILDWRDGYEGPRGKTGLPRSGAPRPPKRSVS